MESKFIDKIPDYVRSVCQTLHASGFSSYVVGGAIRDIALGLEPKDFDVTTNATPAQVESIFKHTIPTGKKFGTITVLLKEGESQAVEVTTFRKEANYTDGSRADNVTFSDTLIDDLSKRDFTINAIAYDPITDTVHDPFAGLNDIEKKLLQSVDSASERIREDALRMMRGVRIRVQKGFTMSDLLINSIKEHSQLINHVSKERIADELCKILLSSRPRQGIEDLLELGLLEHILPELSACASIKQREDYHKYDVFGHITHALDYTNDDLIVRLTILLHDIGKPATHSIDKKNIIHFYGHELESEKMAEQILERLKFSNKIKNSVIQLVLHHMRNVESNKSLRKLLSILQTHEQAMRFARIRFADKMGGGKRDYELGYELYQKLVERINIIWAEKQPLHLADLCVNGRDVMEVLGKGAGPKVGTVLHTLLDRVIENPALNSYSTLLKMIPEIYEEI